MFRIHTFSWSCLCQSCQSCQLRKWWHWVIATFIANGSYISYISGVCIVETKIPVELGGILQQKSATFVWELMFTRSLFQTQDMIAQHRLLNTVADLIDSKEIETTMKELFTPINAENLRKAHKKLESGTMIGKIVLSGF